MIQASAPEQRVATSQSSVVPELPAAVQNLVLCTATSAVAVILAAA